MHKLPEIIFLLGKSEQIQEVDRFHKELVEFYKDLPDELLEVNPVPDGWTIARNMKHVASTNRLFAKWFSLPQAILKLRGKPKITSITLDKIVVTNRPKVEYGLYSQNSGATGNKLKKQDLLNGILESSQVLQKAMEKRTQEEMENLSAPFGGFNLQYFTMFLLKHNHHHSNVVRIRVEDYLSK